MTIKTFDESGAINDIRIDPATGDLAFVKGKDAYAVIIADAVRTVEGELDMASPTSQPCSRQLGFVAYGALAYRRWFIPCHL